jgi:hypothetical protein
MRSQLDHHGLVVPLARADEELNRLPGQTGLDGDRLTGLAFQAADQAANDQCGVVPVLNASEPGKIALEKIGQAACTIRDGFRSKRGVAQQGLRLRVIQERHRCASVRAPSPSHDSG